MKIKITAVILSVLLAAGFSGCADKEEVPTEVTAVNNYVKKDSDELVTGEVMAISGNYVTLSLGTVTDSDNTAEENSENADWDFSDKEMPSGDMPDFGGEMTSEEMPDFGNGERPNFEGGEMRGERKIRKSIEKNGSEESYIIPVGMPIEGLSGRSTDYSGITEGIILTLTVNENGIVCAAAVN